MAQKNKKTGLTDREQLFVLEYMKDLNATQSAIRAWYSEKSAKEIWCQNLTKLHIVEAVTQELKNKFSKVEKDGDRVIQCLVELTERCMQKVPVMRYNKEIKEMEQVTEDWQWVRTFDSSWANSALEKLGKYHKLFTDKSENTNIVKVDFGWLTDEQLLALVTTK